MSDKVHVTVRQIDASASRGEARSHPLVMDRPEAKGGGNHGPMGGEVLLQGLGGCFMSNLLAAAAARKVAVSDASLAISATVTPSPTRFTDIDMHISLSCDHPGEKAKLVEIAERGCLVANTLKNALRLNFHLREM